MHLSHAPSKLFLAEVPDGRVSWIQIPGSDLEQLTHLCVFFVWIRFKGTATFGRKGKEAAGGGLTTTVRFAGVCLSQALTWFLFFFLKGRAKGIWGFVFLDGHLLKQTKLNQDLMGEYSNELNLNCSSCKSLGRSQMKFYIFCLEKLVAGQSSRKKMRRKCQNIQTIGAIIMSS